MAAPGLNYLNRFYPFKNQSIIAREEGMAALIALCALSIFSLVSFYMAFGAKTELRISDNHESEVQAVYARLRRINPAIAGEDAGTLLFEFDGGATGVFDGNRCNDHPAADPRRTMGECWIEGSRGVLRLDGEARLHFKPHRGAEREHEYDRGRDDTWGGGACEWLQRHVIAHLVQGAPVENTAREYLVNLKVQEAVYRSHAEGCRIDMDKFDPLERPITATFGPPAPAAAGDH